MRIKYDQCIEFYENSKNCVMPLKYLTMLYVQRVKFVEEQNN